MNKLKIIDLFSGAGGATLGFELSGIAEVIACINHDSLAIRSHAQNHPNCKHFTEDITLFDEKILPQCDVIFAGVECTHHSRAKGGLPREADSRSLAEHLYRYIEHCKPTYLIVENVPDFLSWGPLRQKNDKKGNLVFTKEGKPYMIPDTDINKQGSSFVRWVQTIKAMGYEYRHKFLNSADFGAYQSRKRYFGIFAKKGFPLQFPSATHNKTGVAGLKKWKPVKEILNFEDKGESIFNRKKPLSEKTLGRILAGLHKFVAKSQTAFIVKYLSNNAKTGINAGASIENPLHTVSTQSRMAVLQTESFIDDYRSRECAISDVESPMKTVTQINKSLVTSEFLTKYYKTGKNIKDVESPLPTITTVDKFALVQSESWLYTDQYDNKGYSIEQPHPTIVACKKYTALMQAEFGQNIAFCDNDSPNMRMIKEFCAEYFISDIKMRMLRISELKQAQGFPKDYILLGSQQVQKKHIGNAVVPIVAQRIIETINKALEKYEK